MNISERSQHNNRPDKYQDKVKDEGALEETINIFVNKPIDSTVTPDGSANVFNEPIISNDGMVKVELSHILSNQEPLG